MEYIIYFDISAIFLCVVIAFSAFYRKVTSSSSGKWFFAIVCANIFASIFDILSVNQNISNSLVNASEYLYLASRTATSFTFCIYLISLTDTKHLFFRRKLLTVLLIVPAIAAAGLLFANAFTKCVFSYSTDSISGLRELEAGPLKLLYIGISFLYLLYGFAYITYFRKLFKIDKLIGAYAIYPITILAVGLEGIFERYLLEMLATSLSLLFVQITVERTDETVDIDTGTMKYGAFVIDSENACITKKNVHIIVANTINFESLRTFLGFNEMVILKRTISDKIKEIVNVYSKHASHYSLGKGRFAVVIDKKRQIDELEICSKIKDALNTLVTINDNTVEIFTNILEFDCPEDISSAKMCLNVIETFSNNTNMLSNISILKNQKNKNDLLVLNEIDSILERGFANNSYEIYYQPIYDIKTKKFSSAEALLRLKDEKYGYISPSVFIPYAEKNGIIHKIGAFVLEEVCKFISSDEFKKLNVEYIEINLSTVQCMKDGFVQKFLDTIKKYNVPSSCINLEITETADAFSEKIMIRNITKLKKAGFSFSLDDYGTGYSNLQRISTLPLNIIKIDKSFVDSMNNGKMLGVLEHTVNMIKSLSVKIVVEGVETKEAYELFEKYNCEYIQGYYFSKPLPKNEYIEFINRMNNRGEV